MWFNCAVEAAAPPERQLLRRSQQNRQIICDIPYKVGSYIYLKSTGATHPRSIVAAMPFWLVALQDDNHLEAT